MTRPNLYPTIKDLDKMHIFGQVQKVREELDEVIEAYVSGDYQHLALEANDAAHAAHNLVDLIQILTGIDAWSYRKPAIAKNHERGYYNTCCSCKAVADTEEDGKHWCIKCFIKRRGE